MTRIATGLEQARLPADGRDRARVSAAARQAIHDRHAAPADQDRAQPGTLPPTSLPHGIGRRHRRAAVRARLTDPPPWPHPMEARGPNSPNPVPRPPPSPGPRALRLLSAEGATLPLTALGREPVTSNRTTIRAWPRQRVARLARRERTGAPGHDQPAPYQRGDRVALVRTNDPDTRLRPGDEGTVTRWDPAQEPAVTSAGTRAAP